MSRFAINPPDEDRYEIDPVKETDEIRRQAFELFVASLHDYAATYHWRCVVHELYLAMGHESLAGVLAIEIRQFADLYGWPETLRALAQSMQTDEQFKREAEGRR